MTIWYGGDYNPEQWPEDVWTEDVRLMRRAGVTMATVGVFSWARIQPDEDVFDYDWLDRVIDLLHANGVAVDLATGTASPPPWAAAKYPAMLPQDSDGATRWPGSRQHYAPTSPDYRRLAETLVRHTVERYKDHPAVVLWHINNELAATPRTTIPTGPPWRSATGCATATQATSTPSTTRGARGSGRSTTPTSRRSCRPG